MAPVVHGLEKQYEGRVDFLYLNTAEARNDSAKRALTFVATRHTVRTALDEDGQLLRVARAHPDDVAVTVLHRSVTGHVRDEETSSVES